MANEYITLNSKRYGVAVTRYRPVTSKRQVIHETVGGKMKSQTFALTDAYWEFDLRVDDVPATNYGSMTDLRTAYALQYCGFTDHFGTNQGDVYFVGELPETPMGPSISGSEAVYIIPVTLRKKQT
jgi:hypothetical protein